MKNICEFCGKEKMGHHKYMKTCGDKECFVKARKKTNLEKYGHVSNLHGVEGKEKVLNTLKKKYGDDVTNVSQVREVKEKKKETCKKNYGVDWPMESEYVRELSKKSVKKKYGVDNVSKCKEVIDKIRSKMFEVDIETGLTILQTAQMKRESFYYERYGFKYFFQTDEFKEKMKYTILKKYGVDNVFKSEYFDLLMKERGIRYENLEEYVDFDNYRRVVRKLTEKTFRENYEFLTTIYLRGEDYNLDHIYSIYQGFKEKIEPEVISSIINLQLLPSKINKIKGSNCWIEKEELLYLYNNLNKKI